MPSLSLPWRAVKRPPDDSTTPRYPVLDVGESSSWRPSTSVVSPLAAAAFPARGRWHLVGHDHGAMLAWTCAASARGRAQLASLTALSVPHADAFSAGVHGPTADVSQQVASQYFTIFVLRHSASLRWSALYHAMGARTADAALGDAFPSPAAFQRALWWYNQSPP